MEPTNIQIEEELKEYNLGENAYKEISRLLLTNMNTGLNKDTNPAAIVKMFPTYVRGLPDGSERGHYLALDLGGTNFRVLLITLKGQEVEMKNKIYPIPENIMTGEGEQLFDHIADCIQDFMDAHDLAGHNLPLGFTFSFPCKQEGIKTGRLVRWTKGFCCAGVEGEDVVRLLQEAVARKGIVGVDCVAILNDTVGCLMSCAFSDHDCNVGVILGTGTNACYMEKIDRVGTWDGDSDEPKQVVINTEWGAFGDDGCLDFIRTDVDKSIDGESINPGKQIYEKMISGMYMGEIVRLLLVKCAKKGLLFKGELSEELETPHRFYTKYVSEIEKDQAGGKYGHTLEVLGELGIETENEGDLEHVHYITSLVSKRAAYLASTGIATLLNRIDKPCITVAVDGSLYRYHPHFHNLMTEQIDTLINAGIKYKLMLSEDGSGKGAALVAAVSHRLAQPQEQLQQ